MRLSAQQLKQFILVAIILAGVFARFYELPWHFAPYDDLGVAKTIMDYRHGGDFGWFAVPSLWNYSPFQFLITPVFINLDQPYREFLFWGRLPSAVFGCLGLIALVCFYSRLYGRATWKALPALALLSFSWENIIFAKQMHNYALGVAASVVLLIIFADHLRTKNFSLGKMSVSAVLLALLSTMQYSVLFLVPPFFGALFLYGIQQNSKKLTVLRNFVMSGLVFMLCFAPVAYVFLLHHIETNNAGLSDWNKGENLEFFFHLNDDMSFVQKLQYGVKFYLHNFYLILKMNTAVFSEDHPWFPFISNMFVGFFCLGAVSYFDTKNVRKKFLGAYFLGLLAVWFMLVAFQKVTLSPTRHSLILLPFIAITVSEGIGYPMDKWRHWRNRFCRTKKNIRCVVYAVITVLIFAIFVRYYPQFLKERRDPFNESEIADVLKEYEVDTVIPALWALQVEMLKDVRDHYDYYGKKVIRGFKEYGLITDGVAPYKRIAWISHRQKINPVLFEQVRDMLNRYIYVTNHIRMSRQEPPLDLMRYPASTYRIIYQKEIDSNREIEFSNITKSGINGYFVYILERTER
jgi:hypothetical protein